MVSPAYNYYSPYQQQAYMPTYQQPTNTGGYTNRPAVMPPINGGDVYTLPYFPSTPAQLKITAEEIGLMLAQGSKETSEINDRIDQAIILIKDSGIYNFDEEQVRRDLLILVKGPSTGRIIDYLSRILPSDGSYRPPYTYNPTPYDYSNVTGYGGYSQPTYYSNYGYSNNNYGYRPQNPYNMNYGMGYTNPSYSTYGGNTGMNTSMIENIIQSLLPSMIAQYKN